MKIANFLQKDIELTFESIFESIGLPSPTHWFNEILIFDNPKKLGKVRGITYNFDEFNDFKTIIIEYTIEWLSDNEKEVFIEEITIGENGEFKYKDRNR